MLVRSAIKNAIKIQGAIQRAGSNGSAKYKAMPPANATGAHKISLSRSLKPLPSSTIPPMKEFSTIDQEYAKPDRSIFHRRFGIFHL
ncbi:hypothetical protein FACS1894205_2620 [Alphaproteobacteria bacterium]|nr:hypothetical protein FACS1894205_2620 [Alphaproteobacteria bacterium]